MHSSYAISQLTKIGRLRFVCQVYNLKVQPDDGGSPETYRVLVRSRRIRSLFGAPCRLGAGHPRRAPAAWAPPLPLRFLPG